MQKQAKQAQIAQEVQNRLIAANTNPRTEIRELQTVIQPTTLTPQTPPHHNDVIATPRVPRSRSRRGVPDPIPARSPSVASTIRYPSMGPEPEPPRAQIARTIAREEPHRSRSRGGPEPILPIAEEDEGPRGRTSTRKPEGPKADKAKARLKKQEQGINMGESRIHLGRFAKNFAQVQQKARNAEKAASVPPPKHKTYDDIEKEIEEVVPDPIDTRLRKKPQFPAGAFLKRERLDSEGRKSLRYQGMPIRV